jgi:hypothetical protein
MADCSRNAQAVGLATALQVFQKISSQFTSFIIIDAKFNLSYSLQH